MPLPTAAQLKNPQNSNSQMKRYLGELAEGVASKENLLEGIRNIPMMWFVEPYYEFVGGTIYFKPGAFGDSGGCFYIRESKYPNFELGIDDFYEMLMPQVLAEKFKVTSPAGVADCIAFNSKDCLVFDHESKSFVFGNRDDIAAQNRTMIIHCNYNEIGQCTEHTNIINQLSKRRLETLKNQSDAYRLASVINARTNHYSEDIDLALTINANGLVIYDTSVKKLFIPRDTVILRDNDIISTQAVSVDISSKTTSLVNVYYDRVSQTFSFKNWYDKLTKLEEASLILFCAVRHAEYEDVTTPDVVAISATFQYNIDFSTSGVETTRDRCAIIAGGFTSTLADNVPNYDSSQHTLTIPHDTVLRYGSYEWIINEPITISFNHISSSAIRVFWDLSTNQLVALRFNERLTASQRYRYVTFCLIRDRGNYWLESNKDKLFIDIGCPYAIDGALFGITSLSNNIVQNRLDDTVKAVAHRGYSIEAPENTLPAYILAKKKGYSYAEADINFTSDEVPVLLHDNSIDRTSNGTGNISSLTFEQARQFDYGAWKDQKYTGTQIPSYAEFLELCHKLAIHPYIEMKTAVTITQARAETMSTLVRRAGLKGKVTYISFSYSALELIKAADPYARLGFLADATQANIDLTNALKSGSNEVFLDAHYGSVTRENMDYALDEEVPVEIWTVNDPNLIVGFAEIGVSGVTTDTLNIRQILNESVRI